ncbi:MAG: imidazolonepropionase-like amidohydrolase [Rhodothermales bacterium]|jgi:imidazolonepropionase-like amidohydrolase
MKISHACLITLLGLFVLESNAQTVVLRAGNLVDPATGTVSRNQTILIEGGDIAAIGSNVDVPAGAEVIDLSNSWVFPGLMDAHTHLLLTAYDSRRGLEWFYVNESTGLRTLLGARNARALLEAGFTTVKDIGNAANYGDVDLRRAIERGWVVGPTMLTVGKIIAPFGGQSSGVSPEQGLLWQYEYIDADSPDEVRRAVRQNIFYGANTIKLVADNGRYHYSQAEIEAAVEEAHIAGYTVAVHASGGEAARNAILAGAESIEHGTNLSDELLRLMKERGTFLVGTDFPEAHLRAMSPDPTQDKTPQAERIIDRLRRAYGIGVKMAFGSDVVIEVEGRDRGELMMEYLDVWLAAGIPPAEILKSLTSHPAELMQIANRRGSIKPGLAADIIATPENPLQDIHALESVSFVMKDGVVVKHSN